MEVQGAEIIYKRPCFYLFLRLPCIIYPVYIYTVQALKLQHVKESLDKLLSSQIQGYIPRDSDSKDLGLGAGICILTSIMVVVI